MIKPMLSADRAGRALRRPRPAASTAARKMPAATATPTLMTLVVTDYPENLDRIRKVLKEIDQPPAADPDRSDDPSRRR